MTIATTCYQCKSDYDVSLEELRSGQASWTLCPACRTARAQANRLKLDAVKAKRAACILKPSIRSIRR